MKILRQADAWGVARANAMALQAQQQAKAQSQDAKQQRCEHNRKLAEALVGSWSAAEYKQKFDAELQTALDGQAESFNPNQPKYQTRMPERSIGASDAAVATVAARHERKRREASFVSSQMDRRNNESTEK
jgi:hypothetical protein